MNKKTSLLLVCTGNTDRSPMAAAIARHWNPELDVFSRGTSAPHGEPISGIAAQALIFGGIPVQPHSSASITAFDVDKADLILTMTLEQKQFVTHKFPQSKDKIFRLKENSDIPDPTLWNLVIYEHLRDEIASALNPWLLKLKKSGKAYHQIA